jgi:hypothetical protein
LAKGLIRGSVTISGQEKTAPALLGRRLPTYWRSQKVRKYWQRGPTRIHCLFRKLFSPADPTAQSMGVIIASANAKTLPPTPEWGLAT